MKSPWLLALGALVSLALPASAGDWKLSLGASYRSFDDVTFNATQLSSSGGDYVNGYYNADDDYLVMGDAQLDLTGWYAMGLNYARNVSFDQTTFAGGSDGWDGTTGLVVSLSRPLTTTNSGWTFGVNLSLAGFSADVSAAATEGNGLTTTTYVGFFSLPNTVPLPPSTSYPTTPVSGSGGLGLNQPVYDPSASATTSARLELSADLNLYVLSLGLQAGRSFGPLAVRLEAGPTLNLADFDTSMAQNVTWTEGGAGVYSSSQTDDTLDILFGVYASGGLSWQFSERWEIGVEARWDEVFDDVSTDLAQMDLSGLSFSALVGFSF